MGKRGEYKPPNGHVGDNSSNILSTFDDPNVAWPKRAHWWHYVEENEAFAMWLLNVAAGSPTTAIEQARSLARFLDIMEWQLDDLVSEASENKSGLERRLEVFARGLENQGYKRGTINNYFKAIKSWLRYNGIELTRRIKLKKTASKREMVPSPEQVALIIRGASIRQAVCVSCVAYGGLRIEVLGQPMVYDGIKIGAMPDLDLDTLEFTQTPALVFVRRELSKIGLPYRTYFPEPTCDAISEYLTLRKEKKGENLTVDSPLVAVEEGWSDRGFRQNTRNRHVRSKTISQDIRTAIGGLGKWRPYDLRHYFLTWLNLAVARGACNEGYRIYWAGQRGKTADVYDLYKDDIPSAIVDDMREQYRQAQEFLLPKKSNSGEERRRKQSLIDFALVQGWSEDKIQRLKEVMTRPISFEDGMKAFRRMEENLERPRTSL
jgi:integrase